MWTSEIQSRVFSRVKNKGTKALKASYPNIYFTTSDKVQTNPKFPTIYLHEVGSVEQGQDLDNTSINAVLFTIQIDVTDNESQNRVNEVMGEIVSIMKSMRFSVVTMPEFQNTDSIYRSTARFRRMIGNEETF